jgi:hypothetical protein
MGTDLRANLNRLVHSGTATVMPQRLSLLRYPPIHLQFPKLRLKMCAARASPTTLRAHVYYTFHIALLSSLHCGFYYRSQASTSLIR